MKQFRQDGKRLHVVKNPDPKQPDLGLYCKNHKHCVFCENCESGVVIEGNQAKITAMCKLPSVSAQGNNCLLHNLNENQNCSYFKDVDGDDPGIVLIPKAKKGPQVVQSKNKIPSISISKDGVKMKNKGAR